ncbi:DgyrCDS1499 [Dimorphilus gyrociliatus]|uniref:DgyrCDS1499 n=1 Tax=Dimorphilus gyrociliatus TaxID=2664684 RepID=A0A7I8V7K7_9ANNE|nr:DgyrCDS1499 [Dimorphilus gyrociliatus]
MKKQEKLIEIDFSEKSNDPRLRCRPRELKNYEKSIIYADDEDHNVICPFMGKYSATLNGKGICSGTFRIGCSAPDRMEIDNECFGSITSNLKCVYTWKARRKHYVLAKSLDGEIANCYSFQEISKNSLKFERESWCSYGASTIFKPNSFFLTNRKAIDRCYQPQETNRRSEKVKEDKAQQNPPYDKISRDRPRRIHQEDSKSNYHTPSTSVISLLFILALSISY